MLDIAWPEIIVIGAVALVAIGPKDLPKVMRVAGQWAGKARTAARELQRSFEQLSYEAEIADKLKNEGGVSPPDAPPAKPAPETDRDRSGS
jgi:sec-independent protein translocase protein TatB